MSRLGGLQADATNFRLRYEDADTLVLICAICFDAFADDNTHAETRIRGKYPRLNDVIEAANKHQHGREPEL